MRQRVIAFFSVVMFVGLAASSQLQAAPQAKGSGVLEGVVLGPDDKPVSHASVAYQSSSGNAPHAARADVHGHFIITKLKADNYDLRASGKGVFSEWEKNVTVRSGKTKNVTLRLIYAKQIPKAYTKNPNSQ
jgi:Carboxypeptidase regulatory-like domain